MVLPLFPALPVRPERVIELVGAVVSMTTVPL
jgi:hypothetical protein